MSAEYHIEPTGDGRTRYRWKQHVEPGGSVPGWMINQMLTSTPTETVKGLRAMVRTF